MASNADGTAGVSLLLFGYSSAASSCSEIG